MLPRPTPPAAHRSHVGTAANEQWAIDTATETAEAARVVIIGGRHQCFHLTAVTDEGIMKLEDLPKHKKLYLWRSKVTKEGAAALNASLPECEINLGWE